MSIQAIHHYHNAIHNIYLHSRQTHEQATKDEFKKLLNHYAEKHHLLVVSEINIKNKRGELIRPDGIAKNILNLDSGYWESKANVDLDKEITLKINAGYPLTNTLFQDNHQAVLYQDNKRVLQTNLEDTHQLHLLLTQFIEYESQEIKEFISAVAQFKQDLPQILIALRSMIVEQEKTNPAFVQARQKFLKFCKISINPDISLSDINEMLLQHILTDEIFTSIFSDAQFHQENNIAKELHQVELTFFSKTTKRNTLDKIKHYYAVIKQCAAAIVDHHDKQLFLKSIYENFYKAYNPKKADTLGIVYTPHEIVKFQIRSIDHLLEKHFNKTLADEAIKILDPCTGTGTYICELIDYLPPKPLARKYKGDIFANELGLLPYYIANLNIEYTYRQKMATYVEFEHLCWTDTLDNAGYLKETNTDLFGLTVENTARIKQQNQQEISVILGNPPYNANQQSENDNNKNRAYPEIDARIKNTYVKESNAQKTKLYDMYSRFYRWASDRLNQEQGIIAFVTNNSFINSKTFDGFRKCICQEFDFAYIIDTRSDVRMNPKIAGTTHNVFGIQTGVALMFLIKENQQFAKKCKIFYMNLADEMLKEDKLNWFLNTPFRQIEFDLIRPDKYNQWIYQTENDFDDLLPLISNQNQAIFRFSSLGVSTNRDSWVYDFSKNSLKQKVQFFIKIYLELLKKQENSWNTSIKWSESLKALFKRGEKLKFNKDFIIESNYRPFVKKYYYAEYKLSDRLTKNHYEIFGNNLIENNCVIYFNGNNSVNWDVCAAKRVIDLNCLAPGGCQNLPLYVYDKEGNRQDNITDWALNQFKNHYTNLPGFKNLEGLTKLAIFHYVYAVLHHPDYRKKYALNLKRDFPRLPFYDNFWQWVCWGKQLLDLHLDYETVTPYSLKLQIVNTLEIPQVKLKADKENGIIYLDDNTILSEIPATAWDYQLGNRSALEWILDQYKEKKLKEEILAEQFNEYRFADYKEQVIDLLKRVCTVSIETLKIIQAMPSHE